MRTKTEMSLASQQYIRIQDDVENLRNTNQSLRLEIQRLNSDPRTIEAAVRSRLNMVRANEIVVPIE
jgi:cell division protein FtsB